MRRIKFISRRVAITRSSWNSSPSGSSLTLSNNSRNKSTESRKSATLCRSWSSTFNASNRRRRLLMKHAREMSSPLETDMNSVSRLLTSSVEDLIEVLREGICGHDHAVEDAHGIVAQL